MVERRVEVREVVPEHARLRIGVADVEVGVVHEEDAPVPLRLDLDRHAPAQAPPSSTSSSTVVAAPGRWDEEVGLLQPGSHVERRRVEQVAPAVHRDARRAAVLVRRDREAQALPPVRAADERNTSGPDGDASELDVAAGHTLPKLAPRLLGDQALRQRDACRVRTGSAHPVPSRLRRNAWTSSAASTPCGAVRDDDEPRDVAGVAPAARPCSTESSTSGSSDPTTKSASGRSPRSACAGERSGLVSAHPPAYSANSWVSSSRVSDGSPSSAKRGSERS